MTFSYLAAKPESWTLVFLIVAVILFILAALSGYVEAVKIQLGWLGLAFFALAFMVS